MGKGEAIQQENNHLIPFSSTTTVILSSYTRS